MKCIFCQKDLNGSDEHIIPDSLNGRIHSKKIICHTCNSNIFGKNIDPMIKEFFNPILIAFKFKNANRIYLHDANGELFLHDKQGSTKKVVPKVTKTKNGNKTLLQVTGDPKNAFKLFIKEAKKLENDGKKNSTVEIKQLAADGVPFKFANVSFEPNNKLKLLFNKIAFEYLSYKGFDVNPYQETLTKIKNLDESIDNVHFCNQNFEIRNYESRELTHLIKPMVIKNKLVVYIELFNILCGIVIIDLDYKIEMNIDTYYQDSVSGRKIEKCVIINENELEKMINSNPIDLNDLVLEKLIVRALRVPQEINFLNRMEEETKEPIKALSKNLKKGVITQKEYDEKSIHIIIETMAKLSVDEFPYMLDDIPDEMDNSIHYIHSNLREDQFEKFSEKNNHLIGKGIIDPDDKKFTITGFEHFPVTVKNGISIIKVFVVVEGETGTFRIPYREVFEMEPINEPQK